ncbi:hypothetical protein FOL47_005100 [Perkinsus chesapeaki]|uniref:Protein transport protein Sec24D n=1 Tax=Perkinsus chesapeaki TaxID=330153 RepID=A0A7J6LYX2_PERCH|nr:hypothetical protein FOL47_005100 [Perkinsus chesapeaki]
MDDDYDHLYKIVLVGDATVGKTHLLSRYIKGTLPRAPTATIGVEFATRTVPLPVGGTVKAQIWDTAGQERYRAITSAHYRRAVGALLVYDVTRRNTFVNCSKWMEELRQNAEPDIVILLVGNKIDLVDKDPSTRQVSTEEAAAFAKENGLFFAEASAVSSVNVKYIFEKLLQEIYNQRSRAQAEGRNQQELTAQGAHFVAAHSGRFDELPLWISRSLPLVVSAAAADWPWYGIRPHKLSMHHSTSNEYPIQHSGPVTSYYGTLHSPRGPPDGSRRSSSAYRGGVASEAAAAYSDASRAGVSPEKCPSPIHLSRVPEYAPAQAPPHEHVEATAVNHNIPYVSSRPLLVVRPLRRESVPGGPQHQPPFGAHFREARSCVDVYSRDAAAAQPYGRDRGRLPPPPPVNAPVSVPKCSDYHASGDVAELSMPAMLHSPTTHLRTTMLDQHPEAVLQGHAAIGSITMSRLACPSETAELGPAAAALRLTQLRSLDRRGHQSLSNVMVVAASRLTGPESVVGHLSHRQERVSVSCRRRRAASTPLSTRAMRLHVSCDQQPIPYCPLVVAFITYLGAQQIPALQSTVHSSGVAIGIIAQPFAELSNDEKDIPLINYAESGPMRCPRCRAYANPAFQWIGEAVTAAAALLPLSIQPLRAICGLVQIHQCPVAGIRDRAELQYGSVDYVAPSDYLRPDGSSTERPPGLCFVIDCSYHSVVSGMFHQVMASIRRLLPYLPTMAEICLVLFDDVIHFYRLGMSTAEEFVVADIEEPFLPLHSDALFVNPHENEEGLLHLLDHLLHDVESTKRPSSSCGAAALQVAVDGLAKHGGGTVLVFYGAYPDIGSGHLIHPKGIPNANEQTPASRRALLQTRNPELWSPILTKCISKAVSVDTFLGAPSAAEVNEAVGNVSVAGAASSHLPTLCYLTVNTGGNTHIYRSFDVERDGEALHFDIARAVTKAAAYGCVVQARVSRGLAIDRCLSRWSQTARLHPALADPRGGFLLPRIDCDAVFGFSLYLEEALQARYAYFQLAILHHNSEGIRLLRVHTLRLPVTTSLSGAFRSPDVESLTNLLARHAAEEMLATGEPPKERQGVPVGVVYVRTSSLASVPQFCTVTGSTAPRLLHQPTQLPAFRPAADVSVDERYECLMSLLGYSVYQSTFRVYPRIYAIHDMPCQCGTPTGVEDNVYLPETVAASAEEISPAGVYLIDDAQTLRLYIGREIREDLLNDLLGISQLEGTRIPAVSPQTSDLACRVWCIVQQIRKDKGSHPYGSVGSAVNCNG